MDNKIEEMPIMDQTCYGRTHSETRSNNFIVQVKHLFWYLHTEVGSQVPESLRIMFSVISSRSSEQNKIGEV